MVLGVTTREIVVPETPPLQPSAPFSLLMDGTSRESSSGEKAASWLPLLYLWV